MTARQDAVLVVQVLVEVGQTAVERHPNLFEQEVVLAVVDESV